MPRRWPRPDRGTWLVMTSSGTPVAYASCNAPSAVSAPGPVDRNSTPTSPVALEYPSASKAELFSTRELTKRSALRRIASNSPSACWPGMPKTCETPSAVRVSTTTSPPLRAFSATGLLLVTERQQRHQVVGHVRGCDAGDLGVVVGGRDLDDVRANDVQTTEAAQDLQQLAARHAARLGRAGARRVRRVQHVDVDGDVDRPVAQPLAQLVDDLADALVVDVRRGDDAEAETPVVLEVLLAVQRSPGSDVAERLGVDDALLDRAPERGAVGVLGAEVGVPGVQVRVEVDQRDGSVPVGGGP